MKEVLGEVRGRWEGLVLGGRTMGRVRREGLAAGGREGRKTVRRARVRNGGRSENEGKELPRELRRWEGRDGIGAGMGRAEGGRMSRVTGGWKKEGAGTGGGSLGKR